LALRVQFWWAISSVGLQFSRFLVFLSSTLDAPVPSYLYCKSGARAPVLYGVGATFMEQFHAKKLIKQPFNLNAQCHKDYFPSVCIQSYARSDTVNLVL